MVLDELLRRLRSSAVRRQFFRSGLSGAASLLFYNVSLGFAILHFISKMSPACQVKRRYKSVINPSHLGKKGRIFLFGINVWRKT